MAAPDPDDIYRPIQEENEEERSKEIKRLIPKLLPTMSSPTSLQLLEVKTTPALTALLAL